MFETILLREKNIPRKCVSWEISGDILEHDMEGKGKEDMCVHKTHLQPSTILCQNLNILHNA